MLRDRLGSDLADDAVSIGAVAEATGLTVQEVQAHLDRLRSEQAFLEQPHPFVPWLFLAGLASLVLAAGVTYRRTNHQPVLGNLFAGGSAIRVPASVRSLPRVEALGTNLVQTGPGAPPSGIRVEIIGEGTEKLGDGAFAWSPMPYDTFSQKIVDSLVLLPRGMSVNPSRPGPFRDIVGNTVRLVPGKVHYTIAGWIGEYEGMMTAPYAPGVTDAQLRSEAAQIVADALRESRDADLAALRLDVQPGGPTQIVPPPGYVLTLAGRRIADVAGPKKAYPPYDPKTVARRLELAMLDMIVRDLRPPEGRWTVTAAQDRKVAAPKLARFTVKGPDGDITFDVPFKTTPTSALKAGAANAAKLVTKMNAKARKNSAK